MFQVSHDSFFQNNVFIVSAWQSGDMDGNRLCSTSVSNQEVIVDLSRGIYEDIPSCVHGVKTINHVTLFGTSLYIWSVELKSIFKLSKDASNQLSVFETRKWHDAAKLLQLES